MQQQWWTVLLFWDSVVNHIESGGRLNDSISAWNAADSQAVTAALCVCLKVSSLPLHI